MSMPGKMVNMRFIAYILMIITIFVPEKMLQGKGKGSNIELGIMEIIRMNYGWKRKKNLIAIAIRENVLFQKTNLSK